MELQQIYDLMDKFEESSINSIELKLDDVAIKMKKTQEASPVQAAALGAEGVPQQAAQVMVPEPQTIQEKPEYNKQDLVASPVVGVFYTSSSPDVPAFVQAGSKVKKGDVLGLIEAMKMFNDVTAPKDGVVEKILAGNEELVEFGTALFVIKDADNV